MAACDTVQKAKQQQGSQRPVTEVTDTSISEIAELRKLMVKIDEVDKSKAKCYSCQEFGHYARKCPQGNANSVHPVFK